MAKVELFYDNMSKDYDKSHDDRFVDKVFEHFLDEHIKGKNLKILDAGGGIGRFSMKYAEKHKVVLTEISKGMLDKAKEMAKRNHVKMVFYQESVLDMKNQRNEQYDVVLMMNGVLDYCTDHMKALKEAKRVLHKGGLFVGTVNNKFVYITSNILLANKGVARFKDAFNSGNYEKDFPIHDFSVQELTEALSNSGFQIMDIVGPTNLLRKWEYDQVNDKEKLLALQIEFAKDKKYLNNSTDFLFIAKKL